MMIMRKEKRRLVALLMVLVMALSILGPPGGTLVSRADESVQETGGDSGSPPNVDDAADTEEAAGKTEETPAGNDKIGATTEEGQNQGQKSDGQPNEGGSGSARPDAGETTEEQGTVQETPDENLGDPASGDDVVHRILTAEVHPKVDPVSGEPIVKRKTGEVITIEILAYNDNPNRTEMSKVRMYIDQTSTKRNHSKVDEVSTENHEPIKFNGIIGDSAQGDYSTTITGVWKVLSAEDNPDKDYDIEYLEFDLPAGASVSSDIELFVETGYDDLVNADIYFKYYIPEDGSDTSNIPDSLFMPAPDSEPLSLTWTGDFAWDNFIKKSNTTNMNYFEASGYVTNGNDSTVDYDFSIENKYASAKTGVIFSEYITLSDELKLPSYEGLGISIDTSDLKFKAGTREEVALSDAVSSDGDLSGYSTIDFLAGEKVVLSSGTKALYTFKSDLYKGTIGFKVTESSILYKVRIDNPYLPGPDEEPDLDKIMNFNPVKGIHTSLELNGLATDTSKMFSAETTSFVNDADTDEEIEKLKFINTANVYVSSVEIGKSEDGGGRRYKDYGDSGSSAATIGKMADLEIEKSIVSVVDSRGIHVTEKRPLTSDPSRQAFVVHSNDIVTYNVKIKNPGEVSCPVLFTDEMDKEIVYPYGYNNNNSIKRNNDASVSINGVRQSSISATATYNVSTGGYTLSLTQFMLPAGGEAVISYSCKIDLSNSEPLKEIKNLASANGTSGSVSLITAEAGPVSITKEVVCRTTHLVDGNVVRIYKTPDGRIQYTGDLYKLIGGNNMNEAGYEKALHDFRAGDKIEYLITVDFGQYNASPGRVTDLGPMAENGMTGYGDQYNAYGYNGNSSDFIDLYRYSDLVDKSVYVTTGSTNNYIHRYFFEFGMSGDSIGPNSMMLKPSSVYKQSMVQIIPGDYTKYLGDSANDRYNTLTNQHWAVSGYGNNYPNESDSQKIRSYAYIEYNDDQGARKRLDTDKIYHSIDPNIWINTGVLATDTVKDVNNIQSREMRAYFSGWTSDLTIDDRHKYKVDSNEVVVNYIYIFNDSNQAMPMDDKTLFIGIPASFEWLGFAKCEGYFSYGDGSYMTFSPYNNYTSSGKYKAEDLKQMLNSSNYSGAWSNFNTYATGMDTIRYYSARNDISVGNNLTLTLNSTPSSGYGVFSGSFSGYGGNKAELKPYSGVLIMYMAKVNPSINPNDAGPRTFGVSLMQNQGQQMPQITSKMKEVTEAFAAQNGPNMTRSISNSGTGNGYKKQVDQYLGSYSSQVPNGGPNYIYSYVSLTPELKKYSLDVSKDVVKNSGGNDAEASSYDNYLNANHKLARPMSDSADGYANADDYYWKYVLNDGIHRTVDGTTTWHMQIANTAPVNSSVVETTFDYGVMVDTVDSPHKLAQIGFKPLHFMTESYVYYNSMGASSNYVNIPVFEGDLTAESAVAAGWTNNGDGTYSFVIPIFNTTSGATSNSVYDMENSSTTPYFRVTVRNVVGGSRGFGYDVGDANGNRNTNAYQYTIEISAYKSGTEFMYPMLKAGDTADFYLTFTTDESIETNYNSFGMVVQDASYQNIKRKSVTGVTNPTSSTLIPVSYAHSGGGVGSVVLPSNVVNSIFDESTKNPDASSGDGNNAPSGGNSSPDSSTPSGGSALSGNSAPMGLSSSPMDSLGTAASDAGYIRYGTAGSGRNNHFNTQNQNQGSLFMVESSDWTDTSYTDGEKTISYTDEGGTEHKVTSRNNNGEGVKLPGYITSSDTLHGQVMVESILHESESYDYFSNLKIYDLYGMNAYVNNSKIVGTSGINVDLDSIVVTDSAGTTFDPDKYIIYYTTSCLVVKEHHTQGQINTLTYAGDWNNLESESTEWIKYDPTDPDKDGTGNRAFKIVFRDGAEKVTKAQGNYKIFVDYDAHVAPDAVEQAEYANIEAWTAYVHEAATDKKKPIYEDTTALEFKILKKPVVKCYKSLYGENNSSLANTEVDKNFNLLIFRLDHTAEPTADTAGINMGQVEGIAYAKIHTNNNSDIVEASDNPPEGKEAPARVIYNIYKPGDNTLSRFFLEKAYYVVVELPEDGYKTKSLFYGDDTSNGLRNDVTSVKTMTADFGIDMTGVTITDTEVNALLSELGGGSFSAPGIIIKTTKNCASFSITAYNTYDTGSVRVNKVNENGNAIVSDKVSMSLYKKGEAGEEDTLVKLKYMSSGSCYNPSSSGTDKITFTGTALIKELLPGDYYFKETVAPSGYILSDDMPEFTIGFADTELKELDFVNEEDTTPKYANLVISKKDVSRQLITGSNAKFEIYDDNTDGAEPLKFKKVLSDEGEVIPGSYVAGDAAGDELVTELETNEGTLKVSGIPIGTYFLVETDTPDNYATTIGTLADAQTLELNEGDQGIDVINEKVSASVKITKTDADTDSAVTGTSAHFELHDKDGNVLSFNSRIEGKNGDYIFSEDGTCEELLTYENDGTLKLAGLPKGDYSLVETEAPAGYIIGDSDTTLFSITDNTEKNLEISNEVSDVKLKVSKTWKVEAVNRQYPLSGITFRLLKDDGSGNLTEVEKAVTDASGIINFDSKLQWKSDYYLLEEMPALYVAGNPVVKIYRDQNGNYSLSGDTEAGGAIKITLSRDLSKIKLDETDTWVYTADVLNIKPTQYGGNYASVSYKTIDNYKIAEEYGIKPEMGYSYYYKESDYDFELGHTNYVHAVNPNDIVTYTLNVANVSDYPFKNIVIIDRLPDDGGDTGVVNLSEVRNSEFDIFSNDNVDAISVSIDNKEIDKSLYRIDFSNKEKFTENDFNGVETPEWKENYDSARSFRVTMDPSFIMNPGHKIVVKFDGIIDVNAEINQISWNNFAYRYTAITRLTESAADGSTISNLGSGVGKTITPEPPKVGVMILGATATLEGKKHYDTELSGVENVKGTFKFRMKRTDGLKDIDDKLYEVCYIDDSGNRIPLPDEGITASLRVAAGETGTFKFPELTFRHTGVYEFDVTEDIPEGAVRNDDGTYEKNGTIYDGTVYHYVIDVTDVTDYNLTKRVNAHIYEDGKEVKEVSYTNQFSSEESVTFDLEATKSYIDKTGAAIKMQDGEFSFSLKDSSGEELMTGRNKSDGKIHFDGLVATTSGTYNYTISEIAGNNSSVEYDTSTYYVTVKVSANEDGKLEVSDITYKKDGKECDGVAFVNRNTTDISKSKKDTPVKKTGDNMNVGAGIILMLLALSGIVITVYLKRKKKPEQ